MPLIHCPECGVSVSSKGEACPQCAYPIQKLTTLFDAAKNHHEEMIADLLKSGADANITDAEGATPLMIASYAGNEKVVKALLAAGANPNLRRGKGYTALMDAAYRGHVRIVRALLESGADPFIVSEGGITALKLARKKKRVEIKALLEQLHNQQEQPQPQEVEIPETEVPEIREKREPTVEAKEQPLVCVKCAQPIGAEDMVCPHCKVPILRKYCDRCSRLIPDHVEVCPYCNSTDTGHFRYHRHAEGLLVGAVVVLAVGSLLFANRPHASSTAKRQRNIISLSGSAVPKIPEPTPVVQQVKPSGQSFDEAKKLNARGYILMNQGRYEEAVQVLDRALKSFPPGKKNIVYAYALYNLGRALRLSGHPKTAIPILQERMQFDNQRDVVARELQAAKRDAEESAAGAVRFD